MAQKSLFHAGDRAEMIARIRTLRPDARAEWGRMQAAQMLAHCQIGLRTALGELTIKRAWIGILFGGIAKRRLVGDKLFGRNLPTDKSFIVSDARDFERERGGLIAIIERHGAAGPDGLTKAPHPFFGTMTSAEWEALMWKHLDHHLRQFGSA